MYKYQKLKAETIVPKGSAITLQMYGKGDVDEAVSELAIKLNSAEAQAFKHEHHARLFLSERNYAESKLADAHRALCLLRVEYARYRFDQFDMRDRHWREDYIEKKCKFWDNVIEYWSKKLEELK